MTAEQNGTTHREPLRKTGAIDKFEHEDTTPIIGREYLKVNIVDDILGATNADELIRDLAITISERGVVFFRAQNNLTDDLQKALVHRLGLLTNKPSESTLHIHPILNNTNEFGVADAEISHISSVAFKAIYAQVDKHDRSTRRDNAAVWHSDIQFEPVPADYTSLRLTTLPKTGGDTLWASGYEIYDRFSKAYQTFFEGLTATFTGDGFIKAAADHPDRVKIYTEKRGHPLNTGLGLTAVHPVVRTNPVTGWKSIFALGPFPKFINELSNEESAELLKKFRSVITENHDLTVRFKWRAENDLAIWDNRSAFHSATADIDGLGERFGHRAVGIGEAPYFDAKSKSRREALAEELRDITGELIATNGVKEAEEARTAKEAQVAQREKAEEKTAEVEKIEEPVEAEEPANVEEPEKIEEYVKVEEPVAVQEPEKAEEPVTAQEPERVELPEQLKAEAANVVVKEVSVSA